MNNELQRTPEWYAKKVGKLGASDMKFAMDFNKTGKESQNRINLRYRILAERFTGELISIAFVNDAVRHGKTHEPIAKDTLMTLGYEIEDVGFIDHPTIKNLGASPDGLLEDGGVIEIKCPTTQTHLDWLLAGEIPEEHKPQMLAQLACTGRGWAEFISFDDRIKNPALRIFKRRYVPTFQEIKSVELAAIKFLNEVDDLQQLLMDAYS